jgi:NAD+ synthase
MRDIVLPTIDCEQVCGEIGSFVINVVTASDASGCVIGLSGGVDSSTTAALIKTAFDHHHRQTGDTLALIGYIIPSRINTPEDTRDAVAVTKQLGIRYEILNLEAIVEALKNKRPDLTELVQEHVDWALEQQQSKSRSWPLS